MKRADQFKLGLANQLIVVKQEELNFLQGCQDLWKEVYLVVAQVNFDKIGQVSYES